MAFGSPGRQRHSLRFGALCPKRVPVHQGLCPRFEGQRGPQAMQRNRAGQANLKQGGHHDTELSPHIQPSLCLALTLQGCSGLGKEVPRSIPR